MFGSFNDSSGRIHGFVRNPDGTFTIIDVETLTFTEALVINESGQIVGFFVGGGFLGIP